MNDLAHFMMLSWTSPAYPTGGFSYSHGLEWAVEAGTVANLDDLKEYLEAVLERGGGWVDAVLFVHAWRTARQHLISAAARLIPLGQTDAQIAAARLAPLVVEVRDRALQADLDSLGTSTPLLELSSMWHETQYTRLFRS
jgi:urease accessory protein UreF